MKHRLASLEAIKVFESTARHLSQDALELRKWLIDHA